MKFEKVSKDAWLNQCEKLNINKEVAEESYNNIKIPERATNGSCGYDFITPLDITINPEETTLIPTGIRVFLDDGYFLMLCPRSSCIKLGYTMSNNVGIIDSDYKNADNEGNIMAPLISTNRVNYSIEFKVGDKIAQGIIIPFATVGDNVDTVRTGGFGSTDDNKEPELDDNPEINVDDDIDALSTSEMDSLFEEESNIEQDETSEENEVDVINFNNHLTIYSNIVNDTIVNELLKMIDFAKREDPTKYVSFIALKNKAESISDIENMYRVVNEWYNSIDNPDILSEIYIRDASITLINRVDDFGLDRIKTLFEMINILRINGSNGEKLVVGKEIYNNINEENVDNLYNHILTVLNDNIKKYIN